VALGVYGTTLLDEMNRLANGGTYRTSAEMVEMALAARQWAVQRSVTTNLTDTVGVLNAIAGTTSANRVLTLAVYAISSLALLNYLQRRLSEESLREC
jgi:hypothetical protein